jgi:hypothetical protein
MRCQGPPERPVPQPAARRPQALTMKIQSSNEAIALRRLANQHLVSPTLTDPTDVVRVLGAVQAQDYAGAKWALGMRTRGATDDGIDRCLADGSIVRTHVLRPTWHFVVPADIRWMLALTGPRVSTAMASYNRKLELDATVFKRSNDALTRALRDGKQMTRVELASVLKRSRINVDGSQRLGHLMMQAELDGVVCSGARRGKQFTYALLEERVPTAPRRDRDEALLELVTRYFATRSPATPHDFAWWSGLTVGDATRGIQLAGKALQQEVIDDRTYWSDPSTASSVEPRSQAHLLPNYDEFFIGFRNRSAIAQRLESAKLVTGGNALIGNVLVIDGQLVGGWRRTIEKETAIVQLDLPIRLTRAEKEAVRAAAHALGAFLGSSVELRQ